MATTEAGLPQDLPRCYRGGVTKRRSSVSAEVPVDLGEYVPPPTYPKSEQQIAAIQDVLKGNFLFNRLSYQQLDGVISCMFEKKVEAGTEVMAQGADGDNFYVVQSGTFDCLKGGKLVCTYEGTGSFGELALLYNCPRAATIVARTDGVLWALDRLTFSRLIISDRQKRAAVSTAMLSKMPVLNYLDQHQIAKLADALRQEEFAAGDTVFQQGEAGSVFYLVEEGEASGTYTADDGTVKQVAKMQAGDYFGERALLTDEPRALTVRAVSVLKVLCLDADAFERILGPCKGAMAERIARYERLGSAEASDAAAEAD